MLVTIGIFIPIVSVLLAQFLSKRFESQKRRKAAYENLILHLGSSKLTKELVQVLTETQLSFASVRKVELCIHEVFAAYHNPLLSHEERQDKLIQLIELIAAKIGQKVDWYHIKHDFTLRSKTKMDV